ncbi:PAS domain-containing sensor histidine kinase [Microbacterium sp. SORGH_AS_0888]|uniref:PAS domain-containing sensor histidine kinase n=1 Tax=Microbacterium sp. SORGH_AS_0888 TaxID=3041791 RepID=UPI00278B0913|nr:PAS domain-containing sensor histidine kinase [Microbacterium sp. SORGH_AS_0888]MDQ1129954.1 PAS domain S-box-containing protein [Microbacterium sp. SORGH_AS_0888]
MSMPGQDQPDSAATHPHPTAPSDDRDPDLRSIRRALPSDWDEQVDLFAIVKLDSGGIVRGWNLGAERIKGYTEAEILGSHFSRFYREEDRRRGLPDQLLAAAQRDGHVEDTGWRVRRDGGEFWARVTITAIRSENGQVLGFVKLVRDLTAERHAEQERATVQRTFAHDLLSPLTALRGYLDLLADDLPPGHRVLELAAQASDHLVAMAQALARSTATASERAHRRAPLDLIARGAAALVLPGDAAGRLVFGTMRPVVIDGDVLALRRAIANVLENAAKYSDDTIEIEVGATDADAVVTIRDRGRGIHPDDIAVVVEEGARGRFADDRDGGSGLGLASVKLIMDEHGGSLHIASTVGEGTTVTLTVPRAHD